MLLGRTREALSWHPAGGGEVLVDADGGMPASVITEGNRSVIVDDRDTRLGDRTFHLSVKGVGAAAPMYGAHPFRDPSAPRRARRITRELWMGEAPYGGQGEINAIAALETSRRADGCVLAGVHLCPTIAVVEVPERFVDPTLHYRRYVGRVVQEQRLVPSDVRLFAGSERTLGAHADEVLAAFGVRTTDDLEAFLETMLRTGIAILTMFARTMRASPDGVVGLDLDDVWLDKDAVIAPDGAIFFVDLEALEWSPAWPSAQARIARQIGRNAYELLYAVDVLLDVRDRWRDRRASTTERRAVIGALLPMALDRDPWARAVPSREGGWDLVVSAEGREIVVPFVARAGGTE